MEPEAKILLLYEIKKATNHETHLSLANTIGKTRSVLTRKLHGDIPFSLKEIRDICRYWRIDEQDFWLARTKEDLERVARGERMPLSVESIDEAISHLKSLVKNKLSPSDEKTFLNMMKMVHDFVEEKTPTESKPKK